MSVSTEPTKGEILEAIDQERQAWEDLLAEVGESRMLEPGPMGEEWSFKDLVAHLNGWKLRTLQRLEAVANEQPEPDLGWPADPDDDDQVDVINDWIQEQNADKLLGEVIDESRESFARLAEVVQRLSDEDLNDPQRFPWLEGAALGPAIVKREVFFGHYHDEHEADVQRWLEARG
jgi:hypothetical protein